MDLHNLRYKEIKLSSDKDKAKEEDYSNIVNEIIVGAELAINGYYKVRKQISKVIGKTLDNNSEVQKELKTRCDRKPWLKKKRKESGWDECRRNFYFEIQNDKNLQVQFGVKNLNIDTKESDIKTSANLYIEKSNKNMKTILGVGGVIVGIVTVILIVRRK